MQKTVEHHVDSHRQVVFVVGTQCHEERRQHVGHLQFLLVIQCRLCLLLNLGVGLVDMLAVGMRQGIFLICVGIVGLHCHGPVDGVDLQ